MNKSFLILCMMVFLFGCNCAFGVESTPHRFVMPKYGEFFCPAKGSYGMQAKSEDIFDAAEDCNAWKSEFWSDTRPDAYNDCLKRKKMFAIRYQLGICAPVYRKTRNVGKSGCLYEVAPKYNKVVKYSCFGPDIDSVIKEINAKYNNSDKDKK